MYTEDPSTPEASDPGGASGTGHGAGGRPNPGNSIPGGQDGGAGGVNAVPGGSIVGPSWGIGDDPLANGIGYDTNGSSRYWQQWLADQRNKQRNNPTYDTTNQNQDRNNQNNLIQQLQGLASGDPNSAAQQQLRGAYQASQAQQNALALSGREGTAGSRGMQATMNNAASAQGQAVDSHMLMLQEQAAAQAALAQVYAAQQNGDIADANNAAQTNIRNSAANDAMSQFYGQFGVNGSTGDYQRQADAMLAALGYNLDQQNFQKQFAGMATQAAGGLLSSAGTMWGNSGSGSGGDASPLYALSNNQMPDTSSPDEWKNPYGGG